MPYRRTRKYNAARQRAAQATRERNRMEQPAQDYPKPLPELRMRITIERLDFGSEVHVMEFRRTPRVDVYDVTVDGKPWQRCGLSVALAGLRKACPRVLSARALG